MRWIIWLLLIFVAAIITAIAATSTSETSYVSFFMLENRYDIGLNAFIIFSTLAILAFYVVLNLLINLWRAPKRARQWNKNRKEHLSHNKLNTAVLQYFAGRYSRSLKNVQKALAFYESQDGTPKNQDVSGALEFCILSHLLAAANENKLNNTENSMAQIQKAIQYAKESHLSEAPDGLQLLHIEWLINSNKIEDAQAAMQKLDPGVARRIAALQMQLRIDRYQNQPQAVLDTVKLLAKHKAYAPEEARKIIIESTCKILQNTHNPQELKTAWDQLNKKDKKIPEVAIYAAKHFAILGDNSTARTLLEALWSSLEDMHPETGRELLLTLDSTLADADNSWLSRLEKVYAAHPDDPLLTYLTGRLYLIHNVTARAQSLLEKAARDQALPILLRQRAWFAIAQLAEKNGELAQANACYKEAVGLLA